MAYRVTAYRRHRQHVHPDGRFADPGPRSVSRNGSRTFERVVATRQEAEWVLLDMIERQGAASGSWEVLARQR